MSILRNMFNMAARPAAMHFFGDEQVQMQYVNGDVCIRCQGILRNMREEIRVDEMGDRLKVTLAELVISTDSLAPYGGIERPQLKAQWHIQYPHEERATVWAVDHEPGRGVSLIDESFAVIHLVRTGVAAKGAPDLRLGY